MRSLLKILTSGSGWRVSVRTEVPLVVDGRERRVDLELRLHSIDGLSIRIWVEAKHGTQPHSRQLFDYVVGLRRRGGDALLLVAPRSALDSFDQTQIPECVPQISWQDTARILKSFAPTTVVQTFLRDELCSYLQGEGLVDPDRVTPEHLVALSRYHEAKAALALVCEIATDVVRSQWAEPLSPRKGSDTAWTYQWRPEDQPPAGFAPRWIWFSEGAPFFLERPGAGRFTVGIGAAPGHLAALDHHTREQLEEAGFLILGSGDLRGIHYENIWKVAYPEDILAGGDLQTQGEALASWILLNFSEIATILNRHAAPSNYDDSTASSGAPEAD